uniref:Uncharacterized protein n=1 Tax=Myotis myotis TaxID=51298 RepID=A0A7J7T5M9_MYOMY|nr:hypothetical protein mMyoMyo1_009123 [Myotis myotis]
MSCCTAQESRVSQGRPWGGLLISPCVLSFTHSRVLPCLLCAGHCARRRGPASLAEMTAWRLLHTRLGRRTGGRDPDAGLRGQACTSLCPVETGPGLGSWFFLARAPRVAQRHGVHVHLCTGQTRLLPGSRSARALGFTSTQLSGDDDSKLCYQLGRRGSGVGR